MKGNRKLALLTMAILIAVPLSASAFQDQALSTDTILLAAADTGKDEIQYDRPGKRGRGFHRGFHRFVRSQLGLSEEQSQAMKQIRKEFQESIDADRKAMRQIRKEKLEMLLSGKVDQERLKALDVELAKHKAKITSERLKVKRARLALLTPDQTKLLGKFIKEKVESRRRHGRRSE